METNINVPHSSFSSLATVRSKIEPITENYEQIMKHSLENSFNNLHQIVSEILDGVQMLEKTPFDTFADNFNLSEEIRNYEIHLIKLALKISQGKQTKAAKLLGVKKTTLNNKIQRYEILPQIS